MLFAIIVLPGAMKWRSSLSSLKSYGHANLFLEEQWQLVGVLEHLTGCFCSLIFFIFNINIHVAWKAILSLHPNQDAVRLTCGFCSP
jgi:hypothetical protein